jgi:hypothetical protein
MTRLARVPNRTATAELPDSAATGNTRLGNARERADGANAARYPAFTMNNVAASVLGAVEPLSAFREVWPPETSSISPSGLGMRRF